jgi:hypothetical protein
MKVLTGWPVPVFLILIFGALISTSDAPPAGIAATFLGLGMVLLLWGVFREYSTHAEISRAISIGDGAAALALAEAQLARRSARRRGPFLVYRALAHELLGNWAAIEQDLAEAKPELMRGTGGGASWQHIAQCLRIAAWCEQSLAARTSPEQKKALLARARQTYDADVASHAAAASLGSIVATLALGRLRFAEGDLAGAKRELLPLPKNIRLGPAQRAIASHYLARIAGAEGDEAAAAKLVAQAAALTPGSWFARPLPASEIAVAEPA